MALDPGTKLGSYEIIGTLGAGGLGEVYRARDTRLDRQLAIKILSSNVANDADSHTLQRFEQEARAASALNHPNIVTVYELGKEGSTYFIAMELIEGKTLREMLNSGRPPIRKVIEIAAQIANGLTKAHEAGIAHRDLKPENLMITHDGFVKILDFGLAKLQSPKAESSDRNITSEFLTPPGRVLGTVGYMSPEQASGDPTDFHSDQFSFGLILYEMVTGIRPFHRSTAALTMAAVLRDEPPPVKAQNLDAPAPLCWAIERCLAKDPEKRYAATRDLAHELTAIRDRFSGNPVNQESTRPTNLPVQRTRFIGRDKEVAAMTELLLREDVSLVTVTGPGGIGKTRLAVEVAGNLAPHFRGGIYFVSLSAVNDPALIASVVVQSLGVREGGGLPPLELLRKNSQLLDTGPIVLLLDNFEHLMEAASTVAEIMAILPNLKIAITSRSPLHLYGEREFPVPPLALPDSKSKPSLQKLSESPAVELFVQRAIASKPDFQVNAENASAIFDICTRLDGLPLAIELAAARLKVLSPSSLQARLASRLQLLTGGARDLPQRQQTLRSTIDWSYDLLNAAEQKLFRRMSVFVGGCTLEGIEAVCDAKTDLDLDLLGGIESIVDKSLVQQIGQQSGESRFTMLGTVREYALEKLNASGEEAFTRRAHAAYFLVLAEEQALEKSTEDVRWMTTVALEHANFRAALRWLTESGNSEWGLRLGTALFRFWESHEYLTEGRDALAKLLALPKSNEPTKARSRALFAAGVLAREQGDITAAAALTQESLDIARQTNDEKGLTVSLNALAVNARDRGDLALAASLFEEGISRARNSGDLEGVARSLSNLASIFKLNGDYDGALSIYAECFSIFQQLGDHTGAAWSLNSQGDLARDRGDSEDARQLYQQALTIFREVGDRWAIAGTLADLGTLAHEQAEYSLAHSLFQESLCIFRKLENKRGIARLLECFACSAAGERKAERSLRLAGVAAALRHNIGIPLSLTEQAKLEAILESSRQALAHHATTNSTTMAWLEGWALPIDQAIEEAIMLDSSSVAAKESM